RPHAPQGGPAIVEKGFVGRGVAWGRVGPASAQQGGETLPRNFSRVGKSQQIENCGRDIHHRNVVGNAPATGESAPLPEDKRDVKNRVVKRHAVPSLLVFAQAFSVIA